jgi:predicted TIM-barrel fold metal-dependent hydrolase
MARAASPAHPVAPRLGYGISDADQHIYEAEDAVTRYLDPAFRHAFRWIEFDGRKTLLLNDRLYRLLPNPTFDPVGRPGAMEKYFRGNNPEGKSLKELLGPVQRLDPAFREKEARLRKLDEQGVDFALVLPTLCLGLEAMLWEDPPAVAACARALNRWIEDEWGYVVDGRALVAAWLTFIDPGAAERELARLIEAGCRVVAVRPAPVQAPGVRRSIGDPVYDRVWAMIAEAEVVVGIHAADTGYGRYIEDWGEYGRMESWKASPMAEILGIHTFRPAYDTMAALISHGVFTRHPGVKVAMLELGGGWAVELVKRMKAAYGKMPQAFGFRDPVETFHDHVWVMPFYEEDLFELKEVIGVDRLIFGSDWPHPEGLADPQSFVVDLAAFTLGEQQMVMRENLRRLAGV